ncbi:hypothetical protein ACVWZL_001306 [Bradyrhizobium sp. GM2.4]
MRDASSTTSAPELLLQSEVAELLRYSEATVTRLRLAGKLAYYKGRPVLIERADLELYVASMKVRRVPKVAKTGASFVIESANTEPRPFKLLTRSEAALAFDRPAATIRNWCLFGKIPYLPGRPATIDEADIVAYLTDRQRTREMRTGPAPGSLEFVQAQRQKVLAKMRHRLRVVALRRRMPCILKNAKRLKGV